MVPAYANIFMGNLEPTLKEYGNEHIMIWKRIIDDVFIIWIGTKEEFLQYMSRISTIHHTIKFTHECSDNEITFLDTAETSTLDIKTHIKKTNNCTSTLPHIIPQRRAKPSPLAKPTDLLEPIPEKNSSVSLLKEGIYSQL